MGSSYTREDEDGEFCETCYGRPSDVSRKTHEEALAALRAKNEAMRRALLDTDHTPRCKFVAWQREGTASEYVCVCGKAAIARKEKP